MHIYDVVMVLTVATIKIAFLDNNKVMWWWLHY